MRFKIDGSLSVLLELFVALFDPWSDNVEINEERCLTSIDSSSKDAGDIARTESSRGNDCHFIPSASVA